MKVEIPFVPEFQWPMILDRMTLTSRTKFYGKVGDWFEAFYVRFLIVRIFKYSLEGVGRDYWKQSGVKSPEAYREIWCKLHPGAGWQPKQIVYCHQFRRLEVGEKPPAEVKNDNL